MQKFIILLLATLPAFGTTITNAGLSGFGTTTISGNSIAFYTGVICFGCPPDPLSISADAAVTALTLGPMRAGFIEVTGSGGGEFGNGSATIDGYHFKCGDVGCLPPFFSTPQPFTLGVPFALDVSAFASNGLGLAGSGGINFQFSLFESVVFPGFSPFPGASVIVYDASSVPEPATFSPVGVGLLWLAKMHFARRRTAHG
jgi:hypothetical protein